MVSKDIGVCSGIQGNIVIIVSLHWNVEAYIGAHGDALECRVEAYFMKHGVSNGQCSTLLSHYMDFGYHIISSCSTYGDGESRVDPECEETPLDVYDGMGVMWSLSVCYDSPTMCMDKLLVIPFGFTNVCDTFHSRIQSWRFLLLFLDDLIRYNGTWEDFVRQMGDPRVVIDMKKILHLGHVDNAHIYRGRLRDDMIYYRDGPYLVYESTFLEMIMMVTYYTSWAGHSKNYYEFEA
jgi:hypothetical protein